MPQKCAPHEPATPLTALKPKYSQRAKKLVLIVSACHTTFAFSPELQRISLIKVFFDIILQRLQRLHLTAGRAFLGFRMLFRACMLLLFIASRPQKSLAAGAAVVDAAAKLSAPSTLSDVANTAAQEALLGVSRRQDGFPIPHEGGLAPNGAKRPAGKSGDGDGDGDGDGEGDDAGQRQGAPAGASAGAGSGLGSKSGGKIAGLGASIAASVGGLFGGLSHSAHSGPVGSISSAGGAHGFGGIIGGLLQSPSPSPLRRRESSNFSLGLGGVSGALKVASGLASKATGGGVSGSASEKEACFTCKWVLRVAYAGAGGKRATDAELIEAIAAYCLTAPPVMGQGCQTLLELKRPVARALGRGSGFNDVCNDVQLCWKGLMWL